MTTPDGAWHEAPFAPDNVFGAIMAALDGQGALDPSGVAKLLSNKVPARPASSSALYRTNDYDCSTNAARIPQKYLGSVCDGAGTVREHVYARGEPDIEHAAVAERVPRAQSSFARLREAAAAGRLTLVDLSKDAEFMAARSIGHLAFPLAATLIISRDRSRLAIIYASTNGGAGTTDDQIQSIAIYSRM